MLHPDRESQGGERDPFEINFLSKGGFSLFSLRLEVKSGLVLHPDNEHLLFPLGPRSGPGEETRERGPGGISLEDFFLSSRSLSPWTLSLSLRPRSGQDGGLRTQVAGVRSLAANCTKMASGLPEDVRTQVDQDKGPTKGTYARKRCHAHRLRA